MRLTRQTHAGTAFGLVLLAVPFLHLLRPMGAGPTGASRVEVLQSGVMAGSSPTQVALRQAAGYRNRARSAVSREQDRLEAWDPQACGGVDWEAWRLQEMARDAGGELRQARALAEDAARRARTPAEAYRAAEFLVLVEHEAGHHEAEWRQAARLLELAPGSERAQRVHRRAVDCRPRTRPAVHTARKSIDLPELSPPGAP